MINEIEQEFAEAPEKVNELLRLWRVFTGRGVVLFGMIVIIILILTAFFAPFIAPYDPYDQNLETVLLSPSMAHTIPLHHIETWFQMWPSVNRLVSLAME